MASHSYLTILLLLALVSLCAAAADGSNDVTTDLDATNDGSDSTDLDAARCARAAATVDEILAVHNDARQAVGVPPLTWSAQIAGYVRQELRALAARRLHAAQVPAVLLLREHLRGEGKALERHGAGGGVGGGGEVVRLREQLVHSAPAGAGGRVRPVHAQVVWACGATHTRSGCARIVCDSGDTFARLRLLPTRQLRHRKAVLISQIAVVPTPIFVHSSVQRFDNCHSSIDSYYVVYSIRSVLLTIYFPPSVMSLAELKSLLCLLL
jgi:pathogenesis-related protein 1